MLQNYKRAERTLALKEIEKVVMKKGWIREVWYYNQSSYILIS